MSEKTNLTRCFFLVSRSQYQTCHVKLEGDNQPLGAIHVQGQNYGFLRKVEDATQAFRLLLKLNAQNTAVTLTQSAVGYMVWTLEPNSTPTKPLHPGAAQHPPCKLNPSRFTSLKQSGKTFAKFVFPIWNRNWWPLR